MSWDVEYTDEFGAWWDELSDNQRESLIGGDKTGKDRWYDVFIPIADLLYDNHLAQLRQEGLLDG